MAVDLQDKNETERDGVYDKDGAWKPARSPDADEKTATGEGSGSAAAQRPGELSAAELQSAETAGASGTAAANSTADNPLAQEKESDKGFYKDEGKPQKRKSKSRRRMLIAGGAAGGGLFIGLMVLIIFLGSLKAVHFATVIRNASFATTQVVMKREFARIGYENAVLTEDSARGLSVPERTMLDRVRGINAQKTMDLLGTSDEFKVFQDKTGVKGFDVKGTRYTFDDFANKFTNKDGTPKTFDQLSFTEKLTVKNDILNTAEDGLSDTFRAESRTFRNSFFKGFREHFDISTSKFGRTLRDYFGKTPTEAETKIRTDTVTEIEAGQSPPPSSISQVEDAAQGTDDAIQQDVKNNLRQRSQQWLDEGLKKAGVEDGLTGLEDTLGKVSTGVMVATAYCMIHDANSSIKDIDAQNEARAYRYAHDIQTTGQEIQSPDINAEAAGAASSLYDGSANVPPGNASALYLQKTYGTSGDFDSASAKNLPAARSGDQGWVDAVNKIDSVVLAAMGPLNFGGVAQKVVDDTCSVILHPAGQIGIVGLEAALTALTAGGDETFLQALGQSLKKMGAEFATVQGAGTFAFFAGLQAGLQVLVKLHANTAFSGAETGADRVNSGFISSNYLNSAVGRGVAYGRPLTTEESKHSSQVAMADMKQSYQNKPFRERYFAADNPYSLTGNLAAIMPSSFASLVSSVKVNLAHLGSTLTNFLGGNNGAKFALSVAGFGQKARAAGSDDLMADNNYFGVPQWGWTPEELSRVDSDPSFDTITNAGWVQDHNANGELDNKYGPCYSSDSVNDIPDSNCSQSDLSSDPALHWRLYKLQSSIIDQMNDNEVTSDSAAATPAPAENGPVGNLTETSVNVPCASGTNDVGIADGYTGGNLVKIKLCAVPGLPSSGEESTPGSSFYVQGANGLGLVNSRVSGTVLNMINAAKAAGIPVGADSTFRTMAHQQSLCGGTCDGSLVARPGNSNHQMGLAIDFKMPHVTGSSTTSCSGRAREPGNPVWDWLLKNAGNFGYKQYTYESWHWDPVDTPSRCGPNQ